MKLKKLTALTLAAAAFMSTTAFANDDNITVMYNSKPITFQYAQPTIVNSRTLVPLRGVFDTMGYTISYDEVTKTATITDSIITIKASSEQMSITKNGVTTVMKSDVKPQLINDYFMLPLRAVATATGAEVNWDAETRTVLISSEDAYEGSMQVEEKVYLAKVQQTTTAVKLFAIDNDDELLKNALGMAFMDSVEAGGDADYYKTVLDNLAELKALEAPDDMIEVQKLVESYTDELTALLTSTEGASASELGEKSTLTSKNLSVISQEFGEKLWEYFTDNNVYFEAIYGDSILDALK